MQLKLLFGLLSDYSYSSLLIDGIGIVAPFNAPVEQFLTIQDAERPSPLSPLVPHANGTSDDRGSLQVVNGHGMVRPSPPMLPTSSR